MSEYPYRGTQARVLAYVLKIGHALYIPAIEMNKIPQRTALEAKALVLLAFRNGPIENIHSGHKICPTCKTHLNRISDVEMKEIMIFAVDRVATLIMLREKNVDRYETLVLRALDYVRGWDDPVIVREYLRPYRQMHEGSL